MFFIWRTAIYSCSCFRISSPVALKKDKKKHSGILVVNGFGREGGFDRGEQGPLQLKILINQGKLKSNEYVIVHTSIYQFRIYH